MNLLRLCDANIFRISSLFIPPSSMSLPGVEDRGRKCCLCLNEAKIGSRVALQRNRQIIPTPSLCVCMYVSNGRGSDEEGSVKTFPFGGPQQRKQNFKRDPTQDNPTHTYRDRQISTKGQTCCLSHSACRSSVSTLRSANASEATKKDISLTFNNFVLKQSAH